MSDSPFSPLYISPLSPETTICIMFEMVQCNVLFREPFSQTWEFKWHGREESLYMIQIGASVLVIPNVLRTFHAFQLPLKRSLHIWIKTNNISESVLREEILLQKFIKYILFLTLQHVIDTFKAFMVTEWKKYNISNE